MIAIDDKALCTGCSACMNACPVDCIAMVQDPYGCEYPLVNVGACIQCGKCERVCPILNPLEEEKGDQQAFLVQNKNPLVLLQSTSGGAFSALAQRVIDEGGIVYGHGYGVISGAEAKTLPCVRCYGVEHADRLSEFRNSKYTQSEVGLALRQVRDDLKTGRRVLFSGTPCQCEGLVKYLGHPDPNLLLVDVVCRAVPSRKILSAYCQWLERKYGQCPSAIRFRDKFYYGYRYSQIRAFGEEDDSDFYHAGVESDPMLRAFFSNICDRPACYSCKFKKRYRPVDLTLWDCFEPSLFAQGFDDNRGVTRVLAHSDRGRRAIEEIVSHAKVIQIEADLAVANAREMTQPVSESPNRGRFMEDLISLDGYELLEKWFPDSPKVRLERWARTAARKLGVYDQAKRVVKRALGR